MSLTGGALVVAATCRPPTDDRARDAAVSYAVQRLALDSLFNGREHAALLVIWATDAGDGPALEALQSSLDRPSTAHRIDVAQLAPALPARVITEATLTDLFRRHPDGWAAFYREYPGSLGVIELSPVELSAGGKVATTTVGRSCGEHCRHAWRVVARRDADRGWRIQALQWLPVPDA